MIYKSKIEHFLQQVKELNLLLLFNIEVDFAMNIFYTFFILKVFVGIVV